MSIKHLRDKFNSHREVLKHAIPPRFSVLYFSHTICPYPFKYSPPSVTMKSIGKARPGAGSHVDSHPPSSSSSLKADGAEQPLDADIEKSAPSGGNSDNEKIGVVPTGQDPSVFPDGGFDAWFAVAGGFCMIFVSFGWINCVSCLLILTELMILINVLNKIQVLAFFKITTSRTNSKHITIVPFHGFLPQNHSCFSSG